MMGPVGWMFALIVGRRLRPFIRGTFFVTVLYPHRLLISLPFFDKSSCIILRLGIQIRQLSTQTLHGRLEDLGVSSRAWERFVVHFFHYTSTRFGGHQSAYLRRPIE
jgi:hypothetical protein